MGIFSAPKQDGLGQVVARRDGHEPLESLEFGRRPAALITRRLPIESTRRIESHRPDRLDHIPTASTIEDRTALIDDIEGDSSERYRLSHLIASPPEGPLTVGRRGRTRGAGTRVDRERGRDPDADSASQCPLASAPCRVDPSHPTATVACAMSDGLRSRGLRKTLHWVQVGNG